MTTVMSALVQRLDASDRKNVVMCRPSSMREGDNTDGPA